MKLWASLSREYDFDGDVNDKPAKGVGFGASLGSSELASSSSFTPKTIFVLIVGVGFSLVLFDWANGWGSKIVLLNSGDFCVSGESLSFETIV
jgi:hypothetical protein